MNIHFTSDTHFYHENIIRYTSRPFQNKFEMNDLLIENWNRVVGPDDDVWHLGDFAFCSLNQLNSILSRLNGNIHVVLGNHDKVIRKNQKVLLSSGSLKSIQEYKELKHEGQLIVLIHYSLRVWHHAYRGSWCLYGHSHGALPPYGKSVDIGVDSVEISSEYRPYSFQEIKKYMDARETSEKV